MSELLRVRFLGVGESCDTRHANTSLLVEAKEQQVLFDCGFTIPHRFFRFCPDPDRLDAVWISHFHGDHFLGLPLLILRFWEMGRTRPLRLIGQNPIREKWIAAMELSYPGFLDKLTFPVEPLAITPGDRFSLDDLELLPIPSRHSQPNCGLLLAAGRHRLYYSGDGRPQPGLPGLIRGCDLAVHEAFTLETTINGHGSVARCLRLRQEAELKRLALVHLERKTRQDPALAPMLAADPRVFLPREDDLVTLG